MFTIFDDRLDAFARATLDDHRRFDAGGWTESDLRQYQLGQLRETMRYVRKHSPFYADLLAGMDDAAIGALTFDNFRQVPFTSKNDLRERMYDMLSKPVCDGWIFYETTGTSGRPTPCPRDNVDSLVNNMVLSVCYDAVFRRHGGEQVIAVLGPTEMHSTGDTFGDVCRNVGRSVVKMWPHSPMVGFTRALEVMRELPVTGLFCTPGMAISLAKEALRAGLRPRDDFAVRFFMLTGELATPGLLSNIGETWGAAAYNCLYASQESSILGVVHADERLRTVPLNVYYEVIDLVTELPVPLADGYREGELVITHLYQGSKPLVRYRTGDLVRLYPAVPGDRYPSPVLLPLGRVRDRIDLNGHVVTSYELENLILSHAEGCLDYQVAIDRVDGVDTLAVEFETLDRDVPIPARRSAELAKAAAGTWSTPLSQRDGQIGSITTTAAMVSWKAARVHDTRREADEERQAALAIARRRESR